MNKLNLVGEIWLRRKMVVIVLSTIFEMNFDIDLEEISTETIYSFSTYKFLLFEGTDKIYNCPTVFLFGYFFIKRGHFITTNKSLIINLAISL